MTYPVSFAKRLPFAHADQPLLFVTLRGGGSEAKFEAQLDSGCSMTIFCGEDLRSLGWQELPSGHAKIESFTTASGAEILASPLDVELELESGDHFEITIFGSHSLLNRNLLGRDLFTRGMFGFDLARQRLFLSSFRDLDLAAIFLSDDNQAGSVA